MAICSNRGDGGLGTFKGDFTTCFEDVMIMPAPAIGLILGFLMCFAARSRMPGEDVEERGELNTPPFGESFCAAHATLAIALQRVQGKAPGGLGTPGYIYDPFVAPRSRTTIAPAGKMAVGHIMILAVYAAMMSTLFALEIVVEVRLSKGHLGIGLRPLIPIALFLLVVTLFVPTHGTNAKARRARPHYAGWMITIVAFTFGMMIATGIQLHSLINTENILTAEKLDKPAKGAKDVDLYYNAYRKIDCCIMLILYCLSILVYLPLYILDVRMAQVQTTW